MHTMCVGILTYFGYKDVLALNNLQKYAFSRSKI